METEVQVACFPSVVNNPTHFKKAKPLNGLPRNLRTVDAPSRGGQVKGPMNELLHNLLEHCYRASHLMEYIPCHAGREEQEGNMYHNASFYWKLYI